MFNAYGNNSKHKSFESQGNYTKRFWLPFRVGKSFSDYPRCTEQTVGRALFFIVVVLIFSLLINFVLINGRAFFMQAAAFPEPLATYPASSAISSTVSGI